MNTIAFRNRVLPALLAVVLSACAGSTENGGNPTGTAGASATAGSTGQGTGGSSGGAG